MSPSSWLSWPFSSSHTRRGQRRNSTARRTRARLFLEQLESRVTPSFGLSTVALFNGANGATPLAGLIMDGSGNLYGTTYAGGASGDGTVFEVAKGSGTVTALASFNGANGAEPYAALIMDSSGNLYGTTDSGGASGLGTVFELAQGSGAITTLASFTGFSNGGYAEGGLIMDSRGNLYGTTEFGGASGDGMVFELAQASGTITTLASFNGTNGQRPIAALILDSSGNLYGTAFEGGASNEGTVFELKKGSGTITALASFNGTDGGVPEASLIMDSSGNLYSTTVGGGPTWDPGADVGGDGTVFELAHGSGKITTLASFNDTDGEAPYAGLLMDSSGNLYGTTETGGTGGTSGGDGTVFELAHGSHTITTLASFDGTNNGFELWGGLLMDSSGNLYGTTYYGGADFVANKTTGDGTVFELAKGSSTITTLASFTGANGEYPLAGLIMDGSGNRYGTTETGGAHADGTVFEVGAGSGLITTMVSFAGSNGEDPYAGLIMDSSGNFYGTTEGGGADLDGTVFELPATALPSLQLSGLPSSTTAGSPQTFTITIQNADGTTDTGYTGTVHFTSSDPQAVLPANYTFTAANAGVYTFTATLKTWWTQSIVATDTANWVVSGRTTTMVTAAAASSLSVGEALATAGVAGSISVAALDAYGNVVTGYTGTVHFTSSDAKAVLPANYTFTSADAGIHFFSVTLETAGTQWITATDTTNSSITGTQTDIAINPAAASVLVITGPSSVTAGVAFGITVTAYDPFGNVATGYTGTIKLTSSDSTAKLPATYTFMASDNGSHTFSGLILKKKAKSSITATDTLFSSIAGSLSVTVS